jgi:protease-4
MMNESQQQTRHRGWLLTLLDLPRRIIWGMFSAIWRVLTFISKTVANLLVLLILIGIFVGISSRQQPVHTMPAKAALLIAPKGSVVEQLRYVDPFERLFELSLEEPREILLRDVLKAIGSAKTDKHISGIVLQLDELTGTGISTLQEIGAALVDFKQSGKFVIASGDYYSQNQYLLASYADQIYMHPMGAVELKGYGAYRTYYKAALDKLKVDYHVFRVGTFKSAMEPYLRDDMSPEARESNQRWLNDLWGVYKQTLQEQRQLRAEDIDFYVDNQDQLLKMHSGDSASAALASGLVDGLKSRKAVNDLLVERVGARDKAGVFESLGVRQYIDINKPLLPAHKSAADTVAVIVASGEIMDGQQAPGVVGGDSLAELVRNARSDKRVKALVLRIDSPGGSMFASEIIREELSLLQQAGKPLVVSMASVAASGGYWISAKADQIWAAPTTLTGSIGVYGAFPSLSRALANIGLNTDGVGTTRLSDSYRLDRPLSDYVANITQQQVEHAYEQFIALVGEGRNMSYEQVEAVAEGQVWTGKMAQQVGLVDHLGSMAESVAAAAQLANLEQYQLDYLERKLTPKEQFLQQLGTVRVALDSNSPAQVLQSMLEPYARGLLFFQKMNDPRGMYSYCLPCSSF